MVHIVIAWNSYRFIHLTSRTVFVIVLMVQKEFIPHDLTACSFPSVCWWTLDCWSMRRTSIFKSLIQCVFIVLMDITASKFLWLISILHRWMRTLAKQLRCKPPCEPQVEMMKEIQHPLIWKKANHPLVFMVYIVSQLVQDFWQQPYDIESFKVVYDFSHQSKFMTCKIASTSDGLPER